MDGAEAVRVTVAKLPRATLSEVAEEVRAHVDWMHANRLIPEGIEIHSFVSQLDAARKSLRKMAYAFLIGFVLVLATAHLLWGSGWRTLMLGVIIVAAVQGVLSCHGLVRRGARYHDAGRPGAGNRAIRRRRHAAVREHGCARAAARHQPGHRRGCCHSDGADSGLVRRRRTRRGISRNGSGFWRRLAAGRAAGFVAGADVRYAPPGRRAMACGRQLRPGRHASSFDRLLRRLLQRAVPALVVAALIIAALTSVVFMKSREMSAPVERPGR